DGAFFGADVVTPPLRALANGAEPNGLWLYAAQSTFPSNPGNGSNYWVDVVFDGTPPPPDTSPPVITAVQATAVGSANATISWTTSEPADSQVAYGTSQTPVNPALVTTHSVQLTGLTAGQAYTYRVRSADAAGNAATSSDLSFS